MMRQRNRNAGLRDPAFFTVLVLDIITVVTVAILILMIAS
jgi:hypothetical protein